MNALQQIATIEFNRFTEPVITQCLAECRDIAPEARWIDPQVVVTPGDHDLGSEGSAQMVDRLTERTTSTLLVQFGPEEGE
jgi:hypothetical protein